MISNDKRSDGNGTSNGLSRRGFLKGSGALASSAGLLAGGALSGTGQVPDEPVNTLGGDGDHEPTVRKFTVHAIEVDLVYNRFGLHQPNAAVYVLEENLEEAREASGKVPCGNKLVQQDNPFCDNVPKHKRGDTSVLQPLTIRANLGDIVEIEFHNDLPERHASIHQTALPYEVKQNDGMDVGQNPNTTVAPGESITYRWFAGLIGAHFFMDGANQAFDSADAPPEEANTLTRGLFGGLMVYPPGTSYYDPYTGEPLRSGVQADIHLPDPMTVEGFPEVGAYREIVPYYHSPEGVYTEDGEQLTWPGTDEPQSVHAINYRADPTGNRVNDEFEDSDEIEYFYNSWTNGDPGGGDNVYPVYVGDPTVAVVFGASAEENHVHHLHGHRWEEVPAIDEDDDPMSQSDTIDSQTIGLGASYIAPLTTAHGQGSVRPDMTYDEALRVGAGGTQRSPGDYLFHCHLFPHYGEGMWAIMRVLDKEHEGLQKLPNNEPPIPADSDISGFPDFIPGEFGKAPPDAPQSDRPLTAEERRALTRTGEILPGAPYTDPCDPDIDATGYDGPDIDIEGEVRDYTIVALPADIVYNDAGDHDPDGIVYVHEKDAEAVRNGDMNPEPLVIRANVGDCVNITLRNEMPEGKSAHIHFVSYDVLGSDSLATGFNYDQATPPGEERTYRWFADEEGTIFFHDHITGIEDIMHGSFCALIVEPAGSEWLDPHTGKPICSGTQAIIKDPNGDDFREFALAYQDFAQLVDRNGNFVNPDFEHNQNAGVGAINFRNTPYYRRNDGDPAYVHSSFVHGDPATPVLESYAGDPIRIRLWQATYEEQHNFNVHDRTIRPSGLDTDDTTSQHFGTSEAFSFRLQEEEAEFDGLDNPNGLPIKDYLYGSTIADDLWDGMWGIHREFDACVDHLKPLPDRKPPSGKITTEQLKQLGHPAAFDDRATKGHKAKLTYDPNDDRAYPPDKDARQNPSIDGNPPPLAPNPGHPCPPDAPVRTYDVTAFLTRIDYNEYGDQDPLGIVFALDEHVEDIKAGRRELEPLTIRANQGECVEINLTNELPENFHEVTEGHAHPQMRTTEEDLGIEWKRSNRISLHPQQIDYDVMGSDGTAAGFNWDQTVAPGETITYRWYARDNSGSCILWDHADIRSNRHHGAFGELIIEPPGSTWLDPETAEPLSAGGQAMIKNPNGDDFREYALKLADGQYIVNPTTDTCVVPAGPEAEEEEHFDPNAPCNQLVEPEDQGYTSINYRSEPFIRRFDRNPNPARVYDSGLHGDPATPLLRAYLDDPVSFKISQTADKARGVTFHIAEHQWRRFRGVMESNVIGVDDRFTPGKSRNISPLEDAGGLADSIGDFIYQETKQRRRLESGLWGIFRVQNDPRKFGRPVQPLPDRAKKIRLENRPGWNVAYGDVNGDGHKDVLIGVPESDVAGTAAGAAYLFYGPVDPRSITDLADADVQFLGEHPGDRAGSTVGFEKSLLLIDTEDLETRYVIAGDEPLSGTISLEDADAIVSGQVN